MRPRLPAAAQIPPDAPDPAASHAGPGRRSPSRQLREQRTPRGHRSPETRRSGQVRGPPGCRGTCGGGWVTPAAVFRASAAPLLPSASACRVRENADSQSLGNEPSPPSVPDFLVAGAQERWCGASASAWLRVFFQLHPPLSRFQSQHSL